MSRKIVVELDLDDSGFTGKVTSNKRALDQFRKSVNATDKSVKNAERATRGWGKAIRDSIIVLGLSRHAILNLDAALLSIPRSIITASGELERMTQLMKGLSNETEGYNAIVKQANSDVSFVVDLSQASPFDINTVTDSFVKFRSVGLDPTTGSMQALIDSVAKFGGTKEQLKRASIAIQQMAGKGVISMEEMRQQLAESVPDAMKLMARGVGLSMGELTEQISKGAVAATGALQAMFRQMAIENSGAAEEMAQTWTGLVARLETQMTLFKKSIGDAGYFDEVKEQLRVIVEDLLSSPEAANFAKDLGEGLTFLVQALRDSVEFIYEWRDEIVTLGKVTFAYVAGLAALRIAASAATASKIALAKALAAQNVQLKISISGWIAERLAVMKSVAADAAKTASTITLTGALRASAAAAAGLGSAFMSLVGGPLGVVALAIAGVVALYETLRDKTIEVIESIDKANPQFMTDEQLGKLKDAVQEYDVLIARQAELQNLTDTQWKLDIFGFFSRELSDTTERITALKKALGGTKEAGLDLISAADEARLKKRLDSISKVVRLSANKDLREAVETYKIELDKITESGSEDKADQKKNLDARLRANVEGYFKPLMAEARRYRELLLKNNKKVTDEDVLETSTRLRALKEVYANTMANFDMEEGGVEESEVKTRNKEAKKFDELLAKLRVRAAEFKAEMSGTSKEVAGFNQEIANGKWKFLTNEQKEQARALFLEIDKTKEAIKDAKNQAREFDKNLKKIDKTAVAIGNTFAKRENKNPFLRDTIRAEDFVRQLNLIEEQVAKTAPNVDALIENMVKLEELRNFARTSANDSTAEEFRKSSEEIANNLLPETRRIRGEYAMIISNLKEWRREKGNTLTVDQEQAYLNQIAAINAKMTRELETPIVKLARTWEDLGENMNQVWADAMSSFVDTLADGLVEGELNFESFFNSFMKMIVKAQLQAMAANLVGNLFGPGTNTQGQAIPLYNNSAYVSNFADGGIMTEYGRLALNKYANGGIARRPQVAIFGEGDQPEAYVPLPDGRTIPVTVTSDGGKPQAGNVSVNVINQSGQQLEAQQQGGPRMDGEQMVLDVVLKNARRAGPFRDSLRSAVR